VSLSGRNCEGTRFAFAPTTQQQQQQQQSNNVEKPTRVLEQQLYSRLVFYGRFMNAFLYGGSTWAKIGREKKEGKREENGSNATRIFIRKGVLMIYWKSLQCSCKFVASSKKHLVDLIYRQE